MKTANATLSDFRQSPRKMRGVANLVRGKKVSEALVNLDFVGKRASLPIKNLLSSALANAKNLELGTENLVVKTITVNAGKVLKRHRPVSHGSAHGIHKRTSHIFIELAEGEVKKSKVKKEKAKEKTVK
jgi:large subunit ribosomal protein L22